MLPGYGSVVANASGIGVQDKVPYCGHGGAGGVTSPAALFCWAFSLMFGMRMGFADAVDAAISEPASTRVTDAANRRECFNKTASRGLGCGIFRINCADATGPSLDACRRTTSQRVRPGELAAAVSEYPAAVWSKPA